MNLEKTILKKAKNSKKWIVLPEAEKNGQVLRAGLMAVKKKICNIIFLGGDGLKKFESENIVVINPKTYEAKKEMINTLFNLRKEKGLSQSGAKKLLNDRDYFAVMLLKMGFADGVVSGKTVPTKNVMRPALQIIKARDGINTVSSFFLMINGKNNLLFSDCGLVQNPTEAQLCEIALSSAESCEKFMFQKPKVAFLSYSTHASAQGESPEKVSKAVSLLKKKKPDFLFDGELQADCALNKEVALTKAPKSKVAGFCNTLIFPDLNSGNIGYKLFQIASGCKAIGPIMQGLDKPVNDLSRGASENEILLSIAITALQCKN